MWRLFLLLRSKYCSNVEFFSVDYENNIHSFFFFENECLFCQKAKQEFKSVNKIVAFIF